MPTSKIPSSAPAAATDCSVRLISAKMPNFCFSPATSPIRGCAANASSQPLMHVCTRDEAPWDGTVHLIRRGGRWGRFRRYLQLNVHCCSTHVLPPDAPGKVNYSVQSDIRDQHACSTELMGKGPARAALHNFEFAQSCHRGSAGMHTL